MLQGIKKLRFTARLFLCLQFLTYLKENGVTIHNSKGDPGQITIRTDGVRQVYFQDPDGYWIEVNEAGSKL